MFSLCGCLSDTWFWIFILERNSFCVRFVTQLQISKISIKTSKEWTVHDFEYSFREKKQFEQQHCCISRQRLNFKTFKNQNNFMCKLNFYNFLTWYNCTVYRLDSKTLNSCSLALVHSFRFEAELQVWHRNCFFPKIWIFKIMCLINTHKVKTSKLIL